MVAGNIPGRTQTIAVAIYDAVESGTAPLARTLVLVISAVALVILTLAERVSTSAERMIQARLRKTFPAGPDSAGFSLDVEFQAAAGVTVFFGPSGSGKSLILNSHRRFRAAGRRPHSAGRRHSIRRRDAAFTWRRRHGNAAMCSRTTRCFRT